MLPRSEPWADVAARAMSRRHGSTATRGEILFVCHDAVMQSMAQRIPEVLQERPRQPFRFTRTADAWSVVEVG
jgi:hypothetical protein